MFKRDTKDMATVDTITLYHGTTTEFAESIQREGLIPQKHQFSFHEEAIDILLGIRPSHDSIKKGEKGYVFLTRDFAYAEAFAQIRSRYESASPGTLLLGGRYKRTPAHKGDNRPAIVKVSFPKRVSKLTPDPQSSGLRYRGKISPQHIAEVIAL